MAFDAVAAFASEALDFPYANAVYGSWLINAVVGYFAVRAGYSLGRAALASVIVGATEATVGWWVSWVMGPGQTPDAP